MCIRDRSTSTRCVTQTSTNEPIYGMETDARIDETAEKNIVCDDTQAAQEAQVGVNLLTQDGEGDCYHLANFPSSSGTTIEAYLVEADETLNPNVQTSGANIDRVAANAVGCQGGASGGITKILGIMPINLDITTNTTGLRMKFNNTRALSMDMHDNNANEIFKSVNYLLKKPDLIKKQLEECNKTLEGIRSKSSSSTEASLILQNYLVT